MSKPAAPESTLPAASNTLDLRRLRHLQAAVAEGSLSAAALQLGLSQPALSGSIRSLEAELGVPLLERHRHGVRSTEHAEALLEHAGRIEAELAAAWARLAQRRDGDAVNLRIGCGPSEAARLLPTALQQLQALQPRVRVFVEYGLNEKLMPMVRQGELDCALSSVPHSAAHPELRHEALHTDQAVIVARVDHPLAARRMASAEELSRYPWVLARRWELERKALDELFAQAGLDPVRAAVETTSAGLMKAMLLHGDSLTFVPREMIFWEERCGLLRPLKGFGSAWVRHVGVTTRRDDSVPPAVLGLLECLRAAVRSLGLRRLPAAAR